MADAQESRKHLAELIETLAASAVMMDTALPEDLLDFKTKWQRILAEVKQSGLGFPPEIFSLPLEALDGLAAEATDQKNQIVGCGISTLQTFFSAEQNQDSFKDIVQKLRAALDKILGRAPAADASEGLSQVQRDELPEFINNADLLIDEIEHILLQLETDLHDKEKLNAVFRAFHTLKGEAGMIGVQNMSRLAHQAENILESVRGGKAKNTLETVSLLLSVVDVLKEILQVFQKDIPRGFAYDVGEICQTILEFSQTLESGGTTGDSPAVTSAPSVGHVSGGKENTGDGLSFMGDLSQIFDVIDSKKGPASSASGGEAETPKKPAADWKPQVPKLDLSEGAEILGEFMAESGEHLVGAEDALMALETHPGDEQEINKLFRAFHTIKGVAAFLHLEDIKMLAHETETMMDYVRRQMLVLDVSVAEAVFSAIDSMRKLLALLSEQIQNNGVLTSPYHDVSSVISELRSITSGVETPHKKGPEKKLGEILIDKEIITEGELDQALETQAEKEPDHRIGEILVESGAATTSQIERGLDEQKKNVTIEETIKIGVKKLDDLVDMIGELVITTVQVTQNPVIVQSDDTRLSKDVAQLQRIMREIQSIAMSVRLVPIRPVFQKMTRLIRDLSKKSKKDVLVTVTGEDTEIDKNITELVSDPLVHMVRNSIDHGIESTEVRRSRNKPLQGRVDLHAYHKGGFIVIEIVDDGGGLDRDKILAKAIERGLIRPDENPPDHVIYNMIFEPGFSTADKITDISGRGVGMDVVKRNIEQMRGRVEIETKLGQGTKFIIKLPLTLAIIDAVILLVGEDRYIVPVFTVKEFFKAKSSDIVPVLGKGEMVKVRGELFHVIRLDQYLDVHYKSSKVEDLTGCLLHSDYGTVCIFVDELLGQQQIVIKSLGSHLKDVPGLSGGTILGDGRVGLIIDINSITALLRR